MTDMTQRVVRPVSRANASWWQRWGLLGLIWLLALGLRLALSQMDRVVWGDEPFYLWLGRNWIEGRGFTFTGHPDVHHGPLYPWLVGLLYAVTHDLALASEIWYAVFGSLLVLPVYALGRDIYDGREAPVARMGLIASMLTAVCPALTVSILNWGTLTEPVYLFFVYVAIWAVARTLSPCWATLRLPAESPGDIKGRHEPLGAYALAGVALGLAYLARPEAFTYFVLLGAFVVVMRLLFWRRRLGAFSLGLVLYVLGFGLAFGPYAYYTYLNTGAWMVSEKVGVAYLTGIGLAHGDTAAFDRSTWGLDASGTETFFFSPDSYNVSMTQLILADPRTFVSILYMNTVRFIQVLIDWTVIPQLLLPFVVLGLLARGWTRERAAREVFLFTSMVPVASFLLFFIQARYIVPVVPVFLLWSALGLLVMGRWLSGTVAALVAPGFAAAPARDNGSALKGHRVIEIAPALVLALVLLVAHPLVLERVTDVGSVRPEHKVLGEQLATELDRDTVMMCRYPAIAFHADTAWVPTPNATWEQVLDYARSKGVDVFCIDERELRYRPQFQGLVSGDHVPPELTLRYAINGGGERLVVYEFN